MLPFDRKSLYMKFEYYLRFEMIMSKIWGWEYWRLLSTGNFLLGEIVELFHWLTGPNVHGSCVDTWRHNVLEESDSFENLLEPHTFLFVTWTWASLLKRLSDLFVVFSLVFRLFLYPFEFSSHLSYVSFNIWLQRIDFGSQDVSFRWTCWTIKRMNDFLSLVKS